MQQTLDNFSFKVSKANKIVKNKKGLDAKHRGLVMIHLKKSIQGTMRNVMINEKTIEEVTNRLVTVYSPIEIYLFGSYAWGQPTEDSDLDLFIVVDDSQEKRYKRAIPGYTALVGLKVPNEIIVYTKKEFEKNAADITTLAHKIKVDGRRVYAKA